VSINSICLRMQNCGMLQEVTFRVDYTAPNIGREFGTVYLGDKNVAYSVVSAGWARVIKHTPFI
jgi:staphylococcal nuclease domain-containing protein 1